MTLVIKRALVEPTAPLPPGDGMQCCLREKWSYSMGIVGVSAISDPSPLAGVT